MGAGVSVEIHHGDCLRVMAQLIADGVQVDSIVTDPPYHLTSIVKRFGKPGSAVAKHGTDGAFKRASSGFMGKQWDGGDIAFRVETWELAMQLLKPGGHLVAFSGTRTYHRMACAIEDAGFEIRDQIGWLYGSGFPKSHDVSKAIDKSKGLERSKIRVDASQVRNPKATGAGRDGMEGATRPWIEQAIERGYHETVSDEAVSWSGWGTALKPAWEPIVLARKPLIGTVAANVLEYGTGAINIDASRVGYASDEDKAAAAATAAAATAAVQRLCHDEPGAMMKGLGRTGFTRPRESIGPSLAKADKGRFPANVIHDGSEEVMRAFPDSGGQAGAVSGKEPSSKTNNVYGQFNGRPATQARGDLGSAARFFYSAKADSGDRLDSKHPTVKPVDLMAYLLRLVTPPGGTTLDLFAGSGTTGMAAMREGFRAILIEREAEYVADIKRRIQHVHGNDTPLFADVSAT